MKIQFSLIAMMYYLSLNDYFKSSLASTKLYSAVYDSYEVTEYIGEQRRYTQLYTD